MRLSISQSVGQHLVELGHLGGDGEVNGSVTNLDDEATDNGGVNLAPG